MKTHQGFIGGLERNGANGKVTPYYTNPSNEVVFHAPALMPTVENDDQQIEKKKHVGNDFVHIVWSEHKRDYRPSTIQSQFNDAHLVVYPLPNGLFRIQTFQKEKIPFFGPLTDGMVVNKQILCPLLRQTALNGNKRARFITTKGYQRPFPARNALIKEVIHRYSVSKVFEDFLSNFFLAPNDVSARLKK